MATVQDMKALLANYGMDQVIQPFLIVYCLIFVYRILPVASKLSDPAAAGGAYPAVVTALMGECDTLKTRAAQVQPVRDALLQRDQLQSEYDVVFTANTDFRAVARLGKALKAAVEVVAQLPMSEEDYLALAGRHAALVERVTTKCRELAIAQDFDSLDALAIKLEELKALRVDVSALPQSNPSFSATDEQDGEGEDWINDPVMPDPEHLVTGPQ